MVVGSLTGRTGSHPELRHGAEDLVGRADRLAVHVECPLGSYEFDQLARGIDVGGLEKPLEQSAAVVGGGLSTL